MRTWPIPVGHRLRAGFPLIDLPRFISAWHPDVVHIHHPFPISITALAAARLRSIPVVATNHTVPACTLFGLRRSWLYRPSSKALSLHIRAVLSAANLVTTPTRTAAGMLRDLGFRGQVAAISNGVDTHRFQPSPAQQDHEAPLVLYTGRLDDDKDVGTLVNAIPMVLERVLARFQIGGEGTDRPRLEALVRQSGVSQSVRFSGYVPNEDLAKTYQSASVYAITSPVELQSISTLEAMASGLPVVAVGAGALPELVRPDVNGFLVPPGDSAALSDALVQLISNASLRREMGARSRQMAEQHSLADTTSQYEQIFQRVTHEHKRGTVCSSLHP